MDDPEDRIRLYRKRAEELRTKALSLTEDIARASLITAAVQWDTMADHAERARRKAKD